MAPQDRTAFAARWADIERARDEAIESAAVRWEANCLDALTEPYVGVRLWRALRGRGRFGEALAVIRRTDEIRRGNPRVRLDTEPMVATSERDLDLLERVPAMLADASNEAPPVDLVDAAACARLAGRHREAFTLYERGFALKEALQVSDGIGQMHAYHAACAALHEAEDSTDAHALRGQALAWLRTALAHAERVLESEHRTAIQQMGHSLASWRQDADLASVRGDAIDALPEEERDGWRRLWRGAAALAEAAR
jgi:hypothetical protein